MSQQTLESIISQFEPQKFTQFFREINGAFKSGTRQFESGANKVTEIGTLLFKDTQETLLVASVKMDGVLTEHSSKKSNLKSGKTYSRKTTKTLEFLFFGMKRRTFASA